MQVPVGIEREMSARKRRGGRWYFRTTVRYADGRRERVFGVPETFGCENTKKGAQEAERKSVNQALDAGTSRTVPREHITVPTVEAFAETYLELSAVDNKPSSVAAKKIILRKHAVPFFTDGTGTSLRLDQVTYARIQDYKALKVEKQSRKSVNNHLTVIRRMLVVAKKRGLISVVPEVEWLKSAKPEIDFLTFEEAERLVAGAGVEWRAAVVVGLKTGLRRGELLGLRWQDVDLVAGRLLVRQNIVEGVIGTPKSGKSREVPLCDEALAALKSHRHLRGEYVFCDLGGRYLTKQEFNWPLLTACKRAGLRRVYWHALRHTFASHLVMRGAPLKVVQELLGHATITMTMRYAHLAPEVARDAVKLLDRRTG